MPSFADLGLSQPVLRALQTMGYEEPSPVQAEAIPPLLQGRDLVAQALTGTGKTAAFGIPIVERIATASFHPQALVLAPTRELAIQVAGEVARLGRERDVIVLPIYGGQPYDRQIRSLRRGVHVVVATPGRLLDLLERGEVDLASVRFVVLDEADEMLAMGFIDDVEAILRQVPAERQIALFSATMPPAIAALAERHLHDPVRVMLTPSATSAAPNVEQRFYVVPRPYKIEALVRLLDVEAPPLALVFCATRGMVADLTEQLQARGYRADGLRGDLSQAQREKVIGAARAGRLEVLVATDVAARGLDLPEISHVINFDLPQDPEIYVHRVGRTGRAGRPGRALTLAAPWEVRDLLAMGRAAGARLQRAEVPTVAEVEAREREELVSRVLRTLEEGRWGPYRELVEELADEHDMVDLAAAALALAAGPAPERVEIPAPPPAPPERERRPRPGAGRPFHRGPRRAEERRPSHFRDRRERPPRRP